MKNTLAIAYNGGAYGTYLEWVLNTLLSEKEICSPFTEVGNSHNSEFGHFMNKDDIVEYAQSEVDFATLRFHPKTNQNDSIKYYLNLALKHVNNLVLMYPDRSQELMCVCNYMTKIWQGDFYEGAMAYINPTDLIKGYNLSLDQDLKDIPVWIRREHMSFNLFNSWHAQVEWYFPDSWSHPRATIITTRELFDDFEGVLKKIQKLTNMTFLRDIKEMFPYHDQMISLQKNFGKDQLCKAILESVLEQGPTMTWDNLCLVSQAWIQYQLRNHGYEIKCHNLNDFPNDTGSLRSLIYQTE